MVLDRLPSRLAGSRHRRKTTSAQAALIWERKSNVSLNGSWEADDMDQIFQRRASFLQSASVPSGDRNARAQTSKMLSLIPSNRVYFSASHAGTIPAGGLVLSDPPCLSWS